jgi:hypothetical protein
MTTRFTFVLLSGLVVGVLCGCGRQPDLTGPYTTPVDAISSHGRQWHGTADVFLTQRGESLSGHVILHHPTAGIIQIPITSGSVVEGTVLFSGHAQLPFGTVDVSFHGKRPVSRFKDRPI